MTKRKRSFTASSFGSIVFQFSSLYRKMSSEWSWIDDWPSRALIAISSAGSPQDDLILPIRPLQPPDEVEKHRLRVRRQDPAHREGHADRPEAERVHRVQAHDLRIVVDELFHVTRVRNDNGLTAVRLDQGRFDFPEAIRHPGRPTLPIDLGRARQNPEHEP